MLQLMSPSNFNAPAKPKQLTNDLGIFMTVRNRMCLIFAKNIPFDNYIVFGILCFHGLRVPQRAMNAKTQLCIS